MRDSVLPRTPHSVSPELDDVDLGLRRCGRALPLRQQRGDVLARRRRAMRRGRRRRGRDQRATRPGWIDGTAQAVRLAQRSDRHVVAAGDRGERVAAPHAVVRRRAAARRPRRRPGPSTEVVSSIALRNVSAFANRQQQAVRTLGRRRHAVVTRIEREHVVAADARRGRRPRRDAPAGPARRRRSRVGSGWPRTAGRRPRGTHDAADREQLRHVVAGFGTQVEAEEVRRPARGRLRRTARTHRALAAVVGSDREEPVAVEVMVAGTAGR